MADFAEDEPSSAEDNRSTLDVLLKEMPSEQWWEDAYHSFNKVEQLIRPSWRREPETQEDLDEDIKNVRMVREGSLPFITVLPAGNHALQLTATNEPLECIVFGTMGAKLFVELFCETVSKAQDAGEAIVVHEVQSFVPRMLLSVGDYEFEIRYMQCETLIRRYHNILDAPASFLDDRKNCSQNVQHVVNDLQVDCLCHSHDHRRAYHYIRAWAIHKGLFNTKPGVNAKDFVRVCGPGRDEEYIDSGFSKIVAQFFRNIEIAPAMTPFDNPSEGDWESILLAAEEEPLHAKLDFPYYIRVSLLYTGSSKAKGGEWLAMVDRKVVKLKERLEARITKPEIRIWPQRLVSSKTDSSDDIYEGYVVLGLGCPDSVIPLAEEVSERWKIQVEEDSVLLKNQCFIDVTICGRDSAIQNDDNKPDTRIWPKPIVKLEENRSKQEDNSDEPDKVVKKAKGVSSALAKANDSGVKGAKLRQASDVLNRLRYDREYNIDDCIVGYKDRHTSKIKEKPAADWSSETTDEEFIPEHRIEYFKRSGEVIWDKSSRVDKVFNSGS